MIDVLLVSPPVSGFRDSIDKDTMYINPPLGIGYIATMLRKYRINTSLIDMGPQNYNVARLLSFIQKHEVRFVGISTMVTNYQNGIIIAEEIKRFRQDIITIIGGVQATFLAKETLKNNFIDYVSLYEGEVSFVNLIEALMNGKDITKLKGIGYRDENKICINEEKVLIQDLDQIGFPAWDLYDLSCYPEPGIILTGRGCPYSCIFCAGGNTNGIGYRMRSCNNVVDEIEFLKNAYDISHFFIADYTFIANKKHCISICEEIQRRKLNITWEEEARANLVDEQIVTAMKKAGCVQVQIGIESGNDTILESINKKINTKQVENAVRIYLKNGISVMGSFIIGHHEDDEETVMQTINFAKRIKMLNPKYVNCMFAILTPLPGTPIFENPEKYGIQILTNDWSQYTFAEPIIETKNLTRRQLRNLYYRAWSILAQIK